MMSMACITVSACCAVDVGRVEVLAMLGSFGALWSALLTVSLEGRTILATPWTAKVHSPGLLGDVFVPQKAFDVKLHLLHRASSIR